MSHDIQIACWLDAIRNNLHNAIPLLFRMFNLDINDNSSYNDYFATPMHIAADTNNKDTILLIASLGANVNATDYYGDTPLYRAVENNAMTSIQVLLELGADPYVRCSDDYTPLDLIKEKNTGTLYDFVVPYTKEHKRLKKLQAHARIVGKIMTQYYRSVENVWKPDGVGYHLARNEFEACRSSV